MEPETSVGITQIKYEKTSCYFCNEWLDSQSFKEHIIHCGQVLEKCPHSCSSYVQRKRMRSHLKECPKVKNKMEPNGCSDPEDSVSWREHENRVAVLEQDVSALRSVLNEEIKQRLHLITDVGSLRKHNQIADEWTRKVGDVLTALKRCLNEETSGRCSELRKINADITKLHYENKDAIEWRTSTTNRLDEMLNQVIQSGNMKEDVVAALKNQNELTGSLHNLRIGIDHMEMQLAEMSTYINQTYEFLTEKVSRLEKIVESRVAEEMMKLKELETIVFSIRDDLQSKFISNSELNAKQLKMDCEVKGMKNIVCETEDKCDKLEKVITEANMLVHETQQGLSDLEVHLIYQKKLMGIHNTRGHLIWRIPDYSAKLQEARECDTALQSPIFCNKQYGYHLRLNVHLNGIGTWKGRNVIASITVVPGEFDSLLHWPCKLQGDIILRDQPDNIEEAQDYVKTTIVKKKNEDYHTNQYIYIPHKVIETQHYIRNDAIILEVRMLKNKFYT